MTDQHPNTCNVKGADVTVIYKLTHPKDNLYVEIIENHKRSSAIIDQKMLSKLHQLSEEKRLRRLYGASLVLSFGNIIKWVGSGFVVEEVKVYNYSNASRGMTETEISSFRRVELNSKRRWIVKFITMVNHQRTN